MDSTWEFMGTFMAGYFALGLAFAKIPRLNRWMLTAYRGFVDETYRLYREKLADRQTTPKELEERRTKLRELMEGQADATFDAYSKIAGGWTILYYWFAYAILCGMLELNRSILRKHADVVRKNRILREQLRTQDSN